MGVGFKVPKRLKPEMKPDKIVVRRVVRDSDGKPQK